jgi:hypothetical protein
MLSLLWFDCLSSTITQRLSNLSHCCLLEITKLSLSWTLIYSYLRLLKLLYCTRLASRCTWLHHSGRLFHLSLLLLLPFSLLFLIHKFPNNKLSFPFLPFLLYLRFELGMVLMKECKLVADKYHIILFWRCILWNVLLYFTLFVPYAYL